MNWTIATAAAAMRAGHLSPLELLDVCLNQIDCYESSVRAWVFVAREEARAEARRLGEELARGQDRGVLHGIPIGVKDIFDVRDWPTRAGFDAWPGTIAHRDAAVVARLRQAGAVLLGKTVTTPFAAFDPAVTRNPWHTERTPGGSSSGSAAAVACGMVLAALATQTGGSITRPAAFCGVCGFKPTFGRFSTDGVWPLAPSLDHVGVIAADVGDLRLLNRILSHETIPDEKVALPEPVWQHAPAEFDDRADPIMQTAFAELGQRLGGLCAVDLPTAFAECQSHHTVIMCAEAAVHLGPIRDRYADSFPPRLNAMIQDGRQRSAVEIQTAHQHRLRLRQELTASWFSVLVTPATLGPPPGLDTTGSPVFNVPWSYLGYPTVSLPFAWTSDGLPLCLQLVGPPGRDAELLHWAAVCESVVALARREPPRTF